MNTPSTPEDHRTVEYTRQCFERTQERIRALLRSGRPLAIAMSYGKDSTTVANCVLVTAAELAAAGEPVPALFINSADSGMENPKVAGLRLGAVAAMRAFAERCGLEVHIHFAEARISERYWVRVLAGEKILSTPKSNSDCSVDLKVKPLERLLKRQMVACEGRGLLAPCVLVGTRNAESARRDRFMRKRGENSLCMHRPDGSQVSVDAPLDDQWAANSYRFDDRLAFAPIADWPTESVFTFLQRAGQVDGFRYGQPDFPAYCGSFDDLLTVYSEANGGECLLVVDPAAQKHVSAGCSARTGCWGCSMVSGRDPSMEGMLLQPENAFMRPLNRFRNLTLALQDDLDRRNWVGRGIDPVTRAVTIRPNTFNAETRRWMLRMLLTIGEQERERADRVRQKLSAGALPPDVFAHLTEPQFETLGLADVVMIEFLSARAGLGRHLWAMEAWRDIVINGEREPVPDAPEFGVAEKVPDARYFVLADDVLEAQFGLRDPIMAMVGFDSDGSPEINEGPHYGIDAESLRLFADLELHRWLAESRLYTHARTVRALMALGVVQVSKRALRTIQASLSRHQALETMGLPVEMTRTRAAALHTLNQDEHRALKAQVQQTRAETSSPPTEPIAATLNRQRTELKALIRRRKGLEVLGDWTPRFDGLVVAVDVARLAKAARAVARQLPPHVERSLEAEANRELAALIPAITADAPYDVDLAARFGFGLLVGAPYADLARYSEAHQLDLFVA